ncbi:hypothetical protein B0T18DRAFT_407322 [Schizothecium vesticola]|uniref:Protein kinase domain-containing protein n=1 Tax=Schizothecium vesticola TaxID=314040 RepID=A0AA40F1U3_9PEZI|nr:hypothetical protein B0T18DRAFT_407322 [Schizothecium vesticola]
MSVDSSSLAISGECILDYHYGTVSQESEIARRALSPKLDDLPGQAAFLSLLTRLRVPILNKSANSEGGRDHQFVGVGRSFSVSRAAFALADGSPGSNPFNTGVKVDPSLQNKAYVVKRIKPLPSSVASDRVQLAAITNEVRILASETLKPVPSLVKLIGVAWDELPTLGRHWPRLLIEAADYGNLAEFMTTHGDSHSWDVKLEIALDILGGLQMLHHHRVAHCDLKLENVLVFRFDQDKEHPLGVKYQAKLCDFGFSVIMSDYEPRSTFSAVLGTEPWNAPELSFGTPIEIEHLPAADIYSFALLFARVLMHGGNPFDGLGRDEIRELKSESPSDSMAMCNRVNSAISDNFGYSEPQQHLIRLVLLLTLHEKPETRFDIPAIGRHLFLGALFTDRTEGGKSAVENQAEEGGAAAATELDRIDRTAQSESVAENQAFSRRISHAFGRIISVMTAPVRWVGRRIGGLFLSVLRFSVRKLGLVKDPWEDLLKPRPVDIRPIPRLDGFSRALGRADPDRAADKNNDGDWGMPDFEGFGGSRPDFLPLATTKEIIKDFKDRAAAVSDSKQRQSARAAYQLGVICFEGNCVPKDIDQALSWLEKAALGGYPKAISGCSSLFESLGRPMSPELAETVSKRLPDVAKDELITASAETITNSVSEQDLFVGLRQWQRQSPSEYSEYITSVYFASFAGLMVSLASVHDSALRNSASDDFDFKRIDGYDPYDLEVQGPTDKDLFIRWIRSHRCVEKTDVTGFTLLQKAAASGNLELAKIMIVNLGAKVDGTGATPDWTPLWLSCMTGNIEVAEFLASHGANPRCKDRGKSRTILHFLNKCRTEEHLMKVLMIALPARIQLDVRDADGNTPLISTFIGWDFSQGLAAKYLIGLDADILVESKGKHSPMNTAARSLNVALVESLCQGSVRSALKAASNLRAPQVSPAQARASTLLALGNHTEFYNRRVGGKDFLSNLSRIVDMVADEESLARLRESEYATGTNLLISACFLAHEDLAAAVLLSKSCPPVNDVDDKNHSTALHWAAERGKIATIMALLERGGDPLMINKSGYDVFQIMAINSARLLVTVLGAIAGGRAPIPTNADVHSILARTTPRGETLFDLLVIEGSEEHLSVAETLRVRYNLPYDNMSIISSGVSTSADRMTPTAWLIENARSRNIFTLQQVQYLLDLDPPPRFVADLNGATLLHYAVDAWQHDDLDSNPTGYAVLGSLLRRFPGREHLEHTDNNGFTPLHLAAYKANLTALQIIQEHVVRNGQAVDWNSRIPETGATVMGCTGLVRQRLRLDGEIHRQLIASLELRTAKTYEFLRNCGACLPSELEGVCVCILTRKQDELPRGQFLRFMERMCDVLELDWEYKEGTVEAGAEGTAQATYILEIAWCFDRFVQRGTQVMTEDLPRYLTERLQHRVNVTRTSGEYPWLVAEHEQTIHGHSVKWTRPGKLWTIEERRGLVYVVERAWAEMFGEDGSMVVELTV